MRKPRPFACRGRRRSRRYRCGGKDPEARAAHFRRGVHELPRTRAGFQLHLPFVSLQRVVAGWKGLPVADCRYPRRRCGVVINFVPYSRDIHLIAAAVARSGAALVSIADSRVTPLSPHAKSILLFGVEQSVVFSSITSAVALVEGVAAAMLAHAGDGARRRRACREGSYSSGWSERPRHELTAFSIARRASQCPWSSVVARSSSWRMAGGL